MKLHTNLPKTSKTTNAESARTNSLTVVIVQDKNLPNATSDHFFAPKMKSCLKHSNFIQQRNGSNA